MRVLLGLAACFVFVLNGVMVQGADDFYKDKKIRLIVSSTPGGGNDTYSRLIARHIHKYIPGNPTIIVQNMPGAGGLLAADYLYRKARRDGTVMEQINWGVWNWQVIGDPRAKFDFNKMNAVGVAALENSVFYCRTDRYTSVAAVEKSEKPATVGVSGRQSTGYVDGKLIENLREKDMFEYVFGYPGARQYSLALRQGEVDCSSNTSGSFWDQLGDMKKDGSLTVIAQAGALDGKREADFADAPLLEELAKNERGRRVAKAMFMLSHYGRPYALPPGVPHERVQIMRKAFWKTMKDPEFLAEAKKLRRPIIPTTGADLQDMWKRALSAPPDQVEIVKQIFGDQKG